MSMTRRALLGTGAAFSVLPGLARADDAPLAVVATTGMIADAARAIGGKHVTVRALMGPGVDPHAYRQTRTDILALTRADLVLAHGLYLEAQMADFLRDLARRRRVVRVGEAVPAMLLRGHDAYADKRDPHVWMNPALWSWVVLAVRDALTGARPEAAEAFEANAAAYLKTLTDLSVYAQTVLGSVPAAARVLVTAHDAFGYFGTAYGFEVLGIQGMSTESEAGLTRIRDLVDTLVGRDLRAVFVESSVSDRNMRALIEGAAARGHDVRIGGALFSDAMGPEGTYEGTYPGMIDHNVTVIADALGGTAPPRGMAGLLALEA